MKRKKEKEGKAENVRKAEKTGKAEKTNENERREQMFAFYTGMCYTDLIWLWAAGSFT